MKIRIGVQAVLRFSPSILNCCNVGVTDGRNLWWAPLRCAKVAWYYHVRECHYRRDFRLGIEFIDHLDTRLGTTNNCSAIAYLHILIITSASAKFFQPAASSPVLPWQRLLTVDNLQLHSPKFSVNGGSLPTASFPHSPLKYKWLGSKMFFLVNPLHGLSRKYRFQQYLYGFMLICCPRNVFIKPLHTNECCFRDSH
jgi:hypothetical protein